ncbi:MAG: type III polyketide synthase, partial [Thermoguttaceae bacterium]
ALEACEAALADSRVGADAITHLVTVSCTGFQAPGVDVHLVGRLGLPPTVQRVHVGFMGCHGALNGLRVCRGMAAADAGARVLLCSVELCSLHYCYQWDEQRFLGNAFFADGAAAAVVGRPSHDLPGLWRLTGTGSCLIPDSLDAIGWEIGDHGFEMSLSSEVPGLIEQHLPAWLPGWLETCGTSIGGVESWAVHPGGPRILTAVQRSLGLSETALSVSREVLAELGNMSSPTVLFILQRLRELRGRETCLMLGFGPGLAAEGVLLSPG